MSALAGIGSEETKEQTFDSRLAHIANVISVTERLHFRPNDANVDNCERSLRGAAAILMQLWDEVQGIKETRAAQPRQLEHA
ncbi:hypothetical protein [Kozakia baliensis]|uniref:hypothetical protein n=1 Tax=Kozakia baliensis TaxID=153496 RepID=UPI000560F704|nr:hypothetical protein [Kozakia baliensis]